jgi:hypothetical protein
MRWTVAIVGCLGAVVAAASPARAQEYCVACAEPNAVYRCVIENAQPGGTIPLQTLCLTAMSKAGGHASCAIKRGTVFDCAGPKPEAAKGGDPKEPPSTVQEMADRANKKTADDMKKAGDSVKEGAQNVGEGVSKATKKTWECISSLFAKC